MSKTKVDKTGRVDKKSQTRYAGAKRRITRRRARSIQKTEPVKVQFSEEELVQDILAEAKILHLHMGAAEMVARKTSAKVTAWASKRKTLTQTELSTRIARELAVYDPNLAFLYQNRDKII